MSLYAADAGTLLNLAADLERRWTGWQGTAEGVTVFCTHKTNERGPTYLDAEQYWRMDVDFEFKAQMSKAEIEGT